MSTRACIKIKQRVYMTDADFQQGKATEQVITLYHHSDGYPSGVGSDLKQFLATRNDGAQYGRKDVIWDAERIATDLVRGAIIHKHWKTGEPYRDMGYDVAVCQHGDCAYGYEIDCDSLTLKCYELDFEKYGDEWREQDIVAIPDLYKEKRLELKVETLAEKCSHFDDKVREIRDGLNEEHNDGMFSTVIAEGIIKTCSNETIDCIVGTLQNDKFKARFHRDCCDTDGVRVVTKNMVVRFKSKKLKQTFVCKVNWELNAEFTTDTLWRVNDINGTGESDLEIDLYGEGVTCDGRAKTDKLEVVISHDDNTEERIKKVEILQCL